MPTNVLIPHGGGGTVTAAAIEATFTATGQIYQGTGNGTGGLVLPPGYEIGYDQITSVVNITSTTESAGTLVIQCGAHTFDGGAVICEFFAAQANTPSVAGDVLVVSLFESTVEIGIICTLVDSGAAGMYTPLIGKLRFTPSAAAHTYKVTAYVTATTGTPAITAGAGGTGTQVPAYCRFTKV